MCWWWCHYKLCSNFLSIINIKIKWSSTLIKLLDSCQSHATQREYFYFSHWCYMNIMSKHSYTCHFVIYNDGGKSSWDTIQYLTSNSFASRVNSLIHLSPSCCVGAVVCAVLEIEHSALFSGKGEKCFQAAWKSNVTATCVVIHRL